MLDEIMVEAAQVESTVEATDPRVLRSRRMLMEALRNLLERKEFADISIQEIADEAELNRATFYLHYPDKQALLIAMTDARFRDLIARRGLEFSDCDGALRAIALGLCDFLTESIHCPSSLEKLPLEGSIIPVLEGMFREGAKSHDAPASVDKEMLGTTAAWAIFGAARRWYQTPDHVPAEEMAAKIEAMVKPLLLSGGS